MKILSAIAVSFLTTTALQAQDPQALPLWEGAAPGALGTTAKDIPTITPYPAKAELATGAAVVICPGGGYGHLAPHEGKDYAIWLNSQGISGFVLAYRLGSAGYRHPVMLNDAARAVRFVRARAADWKVDPHRVGIMGSSAGGHLASTLLTHFDNGDANAKDPIDRQSSRPDVGILCYAVISMTDETTHRGSRNNLLGNNPSPELIKLLSNEQQVTPQTPPCFIWHTWEDETVKVENALDFAAALRRNQVHFDLHIYEKGRHGLGLGSRTYEPSQWLDWTRDCTTWLKVQGFGGK